MIHRGIDGALVGVARAPLQRSTLAKIVEIRDATGWTPVAVGGWRAGYRCRACGCIYDDNDPCPMCSSTYREKWHERRIRYWSWWRPWTWNRPSLIERRDPKDRVTVEVLPEPTNGSAAGRVTLSEDT